MSETRPVPGIDVPRSGIPASPGSQAPAQAFRRGPRCTRCWHSGVKSWR